MIYFLSDAHLGSRVIENPQEHKQKFISLIREMCTDATAIYLMGDIFDFWCEFFYGKAGKPKGFDDVLEVLREASSKCEVHFFIGNHDIWTFGWLAEQTGMIIHKKPQTVVLNGKRCFLAHGDGVGETDRKFLFLRGLFHNPVLQFFFRLLPPAAGNEFGYRWAEASRRKDLEQPFDYQGETNESLVRFAKQTEATEHYDYYIFGHRHIELQLQLRTTAQVVILGDFFRQFTYARMDGSGILVLECADESTIDPSYTTP